jgi:hypothetical protein
MPQGIYKEETLILTVKDVKFRTNGVGRMFPLIEFNKNKELKKRGNVDTVIFDNVGTVLANKIGKGSKLKVKFDSNNVPTIEARLRDWDKEVETPTHCPSCGRVYETIQDAVTLQLFGQGEKQCTYRYCPATKRGFMYKMFSLAVPTMTTELVEQFFNRFPVGDTTGSLDSISEFKYVWDSIKSRGTQKRNEQWNKAHPELGQKFYDLELKIDEFLNSKEIRVSWFWHICNFPHIEENTFHELCSLDPRQLVRGEIEKDYKKLSKQAKEFVDVNFVFIEWLVKFFDSYGEKEWRK